MFWNLQHSDHSGYARKDRNAGSGEAFKKQTVEHWLQSGKPGTQIARELGVS